MTTSRLLEKEAGLSRSVIRQLVKLRRAGRWGVAKGTNAGIDIGQRISKAVTDTGVVDPNPLVDSTLYTHVGKGVLRDAVKGVKGLVGGAEKTSAEHLHEDEVRARGQALGSATTHFITGYAAAPLLYQHKAKPTLTHGRSSPGVAEGLKAIGKGLKQRFRSPARALSGARKYYGAAALKPALTLTGVALAGGYMKERIQAGYERAHGVKTGADASGAISVSAPEGGGETMRVSTNVTGPNWEAEGRRRSRRVVNATVGNAVGGGLAGLVTGAVSRKAGGRGFAAKHLLGATGVGALGGAAWGFGTQKYLEHAEKKAGEIGSCTGCGALTHLDEYAGRVCTGCHDRRLNKTASAGIYVYQRDPSEVKETEHPGRPKGPAAAFGTRMSPRHALHKLQSEKAEGWMKENAEFIELGERPGLSRSLQSIVGTDADAVLSRKDAQLLLGERDRIRLLCKEHRHAAKKGEIEYNPNTERDLLEVLEAVETVLQNPKVQALQIVER